MAPRDDFLRLHTPIPVELQLDGGSREPARATALSPSGAIVEGIVGRLPSTGRVGLLLHLPQGTLSLFGLAEPVGEGQGQGQELAIRFEPLSDADRAHLESFITRTRKEDHLRICLGEGVSFREVTNGFERWRIPHRALPEVDLDTVELGTTFLGRRLSLPLLISSMTGGSDLARRINQNLARAAQARGVAIGLGSMRILLADESALDTFAVRDLAPDVPLYANLGAVQLNYGAGAPECEKLVRLVGADGLILHLNPLQEAVQPEGDARFAGLARRIADVVPNLPFPVIAKEVGAGISAEVARELVRAGVRAIDVAGASGTSWSRIEGKRARSERAARLGELFGDWGIPTAECLLDCRQALPEVPLVASGGIRNGLEAAKAIAMGADLVGIARPFLEAANDSAEAAIQRIDEFARELRVAMFAAGARNLAELGRVRLVRTGGP